MEDIDRTFERLRRSTYEELSISLSKVVDRYLSGEIDLARFSIVNQRTILEHGWTYNEFYEEYRRREG